MSKSSEVKNHVGKSLLPAMPICLVHAYDSVQTLLLEFYGMLSDALNDDPLASMVDMRHSSQRPGVTPGSHHL
jgi:hypothetical protein